MKKNRVSISDIAREVGTATSTVSRALNNHPSISEKTKKIVNEVAQRMNYVPNSVAVNLKSGRKQSIGVIVPMISRNFFASAIEGIEDFAHDKGYDVIICQSKNSKERERHIVNVLRGKVDGIISSLSANCQAIDEYNSLKYIDVPLVLFDRTNSLIEASTVTVDDFNGAKKVVEHLIAKGCKRIYHFAGIQSASVWENRLFGYKIALSKAGIKAKPNWIHIAPTTQDEGYKYASQLLESGEELPDAIFFAGDYAALGALTRFKEAGVSIPKEISIVGFANENFCEITTPTLSSVEQYSYKMGNMACEILFNLFDGEPQQSIVIEPELIIRDSSK